MFRSSAKQVAATLLLSTFVVPASAAPLTELYFSQDSAWQNPVTEWNGAPLGLTLAYNDTDSNTTIDQLAWTSTLNNATSSLTVESFTSDTSTSSDGAWNAGEWWRIDKLFQENEVLSVNANVANPNPLWLADVDGTFKVWTDMVEGSGLKIDDTTTTSIKYWETTNTSTAANCTSPNPLDSACDDVYTVLSLSLNDLSFVQDSYRYTVSFRLESDSALVCDGSETSGPCFTEPNAQPGGGELLRVYAQENADSEIFVAAQWNAHKIPVPGSLALMGLGLAGLGFRAHRQRQTSR